MPVKPGTISLIYNTNRWHSNQFQPPFYLESSQTKLMQTEDLFKQTTKQPKVDTYLFGSLIISAQKL